MRSESGQNSENNIVCRYQRSRRGDKKMIPPLSSRSGLLTRPWKQKMTPRMNGTTFASTTMIEPVTQETLERRRFTQFLGPFYQRTSGTTLTTVRMTPWGAHHFLSRSFSYVGNAILNVMSQGPDTSTELENQICCDVVVSINMYLLEKRPALTSPVPCTSRRVLIVAIN